MKHIRHEFEPAFYVTAAVISFQLMILSLVAVMHL